MNAASPLRARRPATALAGGLGRVMLLAIVLLLAATYVPTLAGYHRYVLVGHSMEPSIHRGSLIFDEVVPVADLRTGDVVTYTPPGAAHQLSHRIISVRTVRGQRVFRTKGDNNPVADPTPFTLDRPVQARVKFAIPYLGWAFIVLTQPGARLWLIGLPALAIAFWALFGVWREGGRLVRERSVAEAP